MHGTEAPSPWIQRWAHLVKPGGTVLDVACGYGRHTHYFLQLKHAVCAIDTAQAAIDTIAINLPPSQQKLAQLLVADLENAPWPLPDRQFAAVVVTNYLWRPLLPTLLQAVEPGGVLLYETFAVGNETVGKPSRPDFLLHTGELVRLCTAVPGWHVVAFEDGFLDNPPRFVQRIAAVNNTAAHQNRAEKASNLPPRWHL